MKISFLLVSILLSGLLNYSNARNYLNLDQIELEDADDYAANDKLVLECSEDSLISFQQNVI